MLIRCVRRYVARITVTEVAKIAVMAACVASAVASFIGWIRRP